MAILKLTKLVLLAVVLTICGMQVAQSQQCPVPVAITIGNATVEPCHPARVNIPIFMTNSCEVGGFSLRISTTEPSWLSFTPGDLDAADTAGSRIGYWDMFSASVHTNNPAQIIITAIADMPGGHDSVCMGPGDGLICTIHLDYNSYLVCDTSQLFTFDLAQVTTCDGYTLYNPLTLNTDRLYVLPGNCHGHPRGDANCSGALNGVDVVYLVAFFKGLGPSFCCLCSGDANNSGSVNGLDVTYLVGYFKGYNAPPAPCQ